MSIKEKVIVKLFKRKDSIEIYLLKKVIVKLFKRKDSNEICLLKKRLLRSFLNLKIPTNVFIKKKGYCETFST